MNCTGLQLFLYSMSLSTIFQYAFAKKTVKNEPENKNEDENTRGVVVSCPGKVLIAGGYLVLEDGNVGLTVSGSSRFHTRLKLVENVPKSTKVFICIRSPQFHEEYGYTYDASDDTLTIDPNFPVTNNFVAHCLQMVFIFLAKFFADKPKRGNFCDLILASQENLAITLLADNDFYLQIDQVCQ